jgi:dolichyl-phosphate beta-glucosyltransferase
MLHPRPFLNIDELMAMHGRTYRKAGPRFQITTSRDTVDVSMVIPAYNEEKRLVATLLSVMEYFDRRGLSYEIIVVDDGSSDATAEIVRELGKRFEPIRLIRLPRNMGKGAAVRTGIRNATGQHVIYNDADGATPVSELDRLLPIIRDGADLAIGSRALHSPETRVERKLRRFVAGRIFAFLVNAVVVPGIADTQCGFRIFRKDVAQRIFEIQQLDGFAFDVEVLRIAWLLGYRISEVPVNWTDIRGSKVNLLRDSWRMFRDIFRVRYSTPNSLADRDARAKSQGLRDSDARTA